MIGKTLKLGAVILLVPMLVGQSCPPVTSGIAIEVGVTEREGDFTGGARGCARYACDPISRERAAAILFGAATALTIYAASSSSGSSGGGQQPSDLRLKRDIEPVGIFHNGLRLSSFKYLDDDTVYVGVIAQELLSDGSDGFRQAVLTKPDGYYSVDYDMLGFKVVTRERFVQIARHMCSAPSASCRSVPVDRAATPALH